MPLRTNRVRAGSRLVPPNHRPPDVSGADIDCYTRRGPSQGVPAFSTVNEFARGRQVRPVLEWDQVCVPIRGPYQIDSFYTVRLRLNACYPRSTEFASAGFVEKAMRGGRDGFATDVSKIWDTCRRRREGRVTAAGSCLGMQSENISNVGMSASNHTSKDTNEHHR